MIGSSFRIKIEHFKTLEFLIFRQDLMEVIS